MAWKKEEENSFHKARGLIRKVFKRQPGWCEEAIADCNEVIRLEPKNRL